LPGLSQLDFAVDLVGEADAAERHGRVGGEGLIALEPALRKGVAVTPSALRNFRMLALKTSSFMATSFAPVPAGTIPACPVLACPVVYRLDRHHHSPCPVGCDLATTWRTRSMRVVGLNVSFRRTISIPEFSRA